MTRQSVMGALLCLSVVLGALARADDDGSDESAEKSEKSEKKSTIPVASVERDTPVSFAQDLLPALRKNCLACHNATKARGDVNLESPAAIREGADEEPIVTPGTGTESLLLQAASHQLRKPMPPANNKVGAESLSSEQLGLLKLWIDQGAQDDAPGVDEAVAEAWNLQPVGARPIYAVSMAQDGNVIAGGRAQEIHVYHLPDTEPSRLVDPGLEERYGAPPGRYAHLDFVQALAFDPRAELLASAGFRTVKLWRREAGALLEEREVEVVQEAAPVEGTPQESAAASAATPTGFGVAGGDDGVVRVSDADGKVVKELRQDGAVRAAAVSADGERVASAAPDGTVHLWNGKSGEEIASVSGDYRDAPLVDVYGRCVKLYESRRDEGRKAIENAEKELQKKTEEEKKAGEAVAAAEKTAAEKKAAAEVAEKGDDKKAAEEAKKALAAAEDARSKAAGVLEEARRSVRLATQALDSSKERLVRAEAGLERFGGLSKAAQEGAAERRRAIGSLVFSPDGRIVAAARDDGVVALWSAVDGTPMGILKAHDEAIESVSFDAEGRFLTRSKRREKVWRLGPRWTLERTLGGLNDDLFADRVSAVAFSPDGTRFAAVSCEPSRQGDIKVWKTDDWSQLWVKGDAHSDEVFALDFSLDGEFLASCGADKFARVFSMESGELVRNFEGHTHHVLGVSWRDDGKELASCGGDKVVRVWDFESGNTRRTIGGFGKQVNALAYVGASSNTVSVSGDRLVRMHRSGDGRHVRDFGGSTDHVYAVEVSADGTRIVAGGFDGVLRVWNVADGKLLHAFDPPPPVSDAE